MLHFPPSYQAVKVGPVHNITTHTEHPPAATWKRIVLALTIIKERGPSGRVFTFVSTASLFHNSAGSCLAEGHLTRRLFGDMLRRIRALPVPAG